MKTRSWFLFLIVAAGVALAALQWLPPSHEAEAQPAVPYFSYAAKFVCGWNRSNIGFDAGGAMIGEATVKLGNYATEINIFNPRLTDLNIEKQVLVFYRSDAAFPPIAREPVTVPRSGGEAILLPSWQGTMDDCNKLYQLAGIPIVNPPILAIGYLVIQSPKEIDVTAVYTTELCSDFRFGAGVSNMCYNAGTANFGVSHSIDVEQIQGKFID